MGGVAEERPGVPSTQPAKIMQRFLSILEKLMSAHHASSSWLMSGRRFVEIMCRCRTDLTFLMGKPGGEVCQGCHCCPILIQLHECSKVDLIFVHQPLGYHYLLLPDHLPAITIVGVLILVLFFLPARIWMTELRSAVA